MDFDENIYYSQPKKKISLILIIPFAVLFAAAIAAGIYFFISYNDQIELLQSIDTIKYEASIGQEDVWENDIQFTGESILELNEELSESTAYYLPSGLIIRSTSEGWKGSGLKTIYKELLKNTHGDELDYLKEIVLKPGDSVGGDFAGDYHEESSTLTASIIFNPLIDSRYLSFATPDYGYINLYNMNDYTDVKEIARTLSHEYGHHYTFHYFFEDDEKEGSDYYKIRGLEEYPEAIDYKDYDEYLEMHAWDISEIAAEDYAQLLGSPTSKEIGEYMDIREALYSPDMEYVGDTQSYYYNVFAQENPVIALAEQVKGLENYFYSFIDEEYVEDYKEYPSIEIEADKKRSRGKTHYVLTWNPLELESSSEVVYTVVCYDSNGELYGGIKTVSGEEELSAVIGTPVRVKGSWIYWWDDGTMDKDRIVRVLAYIVDDGIMIGSEPYYFDF